MVTTTGPIPVRPKAATARWVAAALAGAAAATVLSVGVLHDDDSTRPPASTRVSAAGSAGIRGMSPDAAERWLAPAAVDVRGMSPDAADRWLAEP